MAEIRNTIILDNQVSEVLEEMKRDALETIEAMGGFEEVFKIFESAHETFEATRVHIEDMGIGFDEIIDNAKLLHEELEKNNEEIEKAVEHIKGFEEAMSQVPGAAGSTTRAIDQMTNSIIEFGRNIGFIPNEVADIGRGMMQLNSTMRAAIPTAAKLTAALGPISLIAGALGGIFSLFRRDVEEEALPGLDELVGRHNELTRASDALNDQLTENINLLRIMNNNGSDEGLIKRLRGEIEAAQEWQTVFLALEQAAHSEAVQNALATFSEGRHREDGFLYNGVFKAFEEVAGNSYFDNILDELKVYDIFRTDAEEAYRVLRDMLESGQWKPEDRDWLNSVMEETHALSQVFRGDLSPAAIEATKAADALAAVYAEASRQFDWVIEQCREMEREQRNLIATEAARKDLINHLTRSYRDINAAMDSVKDAHYALGHAMNGTSSEHMSQLDMYNKLLTLSPQYLQLLFNETGGLRDLEDATFDLTQAKIELMGIRQENALLDMIGEWNRETGELYNFKGVIDLATESYRAFNDVRLEALAFSEYVSSDEFERIDAMIQQIRGWTAGAGLSARERERGTNRGNAIMVYDVATADIMGEYLRLREDVARHDYTTGAYQQRGNTVIHMGGYNYSPNIYPLELSDQTRRNIIREGAEAGARLVADMMEDAYLNDLNGAYASGQAY